MQIVRITQGDNKIRTEELYGRMRRLPRTLRKWPAVGRSTGRAEGEVTPEGVKKDSGLVVLILKAQARFRLRKCLLDLRRHQPFLMGR